MGIAKLITSGGSNPRARFLFLAALVGLASAVVLFSHVKETEFHVDEPGWIASGRHFLGLVWNGDFRRDRWECRECDGWTSRLNMHLGEWLVGLPVALDPTTREQAFSQYYDWGASLEKNVEQGRIPPAETLNRARTGCAIFGVLCCLLVFTINYTVSNALVGLLAVALLLQNHTFVRYATKAMTDIHYNFFLLCSCLVVLIFSRTSLRRNALLASGLCGVVAALACSVKITGILIGGALFFIAVLQRFRLRKPLKRDIAYQLALFWVCALVIIYGLNPYFWPSIRELRDPAALQEMKSFSAEMISSKRIPPEVRTRYPHLGTLTYVFEFPRLFDTWNRLMSRQRIKQGNWEGGNRLLILNRQLFRRLLTIRGETILLGIGIVSLISGWRHALPGAAVKVGPILAAYFFINYFFILAFMKLNWDRYYLPTIIAVTSIAAVGIYTIAAWICRTILKRCEGSVVVTDQINNLVRKIFP